LTETNTVFNACRPGKSFTGNNTGFLQKTVLFQPLFIKQRLYIKQRLFAKQRLFVKQRLFANNLCSVSIICLTQRKANGYPQMTDSRFCFKTHFYLILNF